MNLQPPSEFYPARVERYDNPEEERERLKDVIRELSDQVQTLLQWQRDVYRFLLYPAFSKLRFSPLPDISKPSEGDVFYDSDDKTVKAYNGSSWDSFS